MALFDDVKKNLMEWYNVTSEKTNELARVSTRKYDKFGISRDIERQFGELGSLVYNGLKAEREDILDDQAVGVLFERIKGLEEELMSKDEEIDSIRDEFARKKAGAAATTEVDELIIKDPVLEEGSEESAILVEPEVLNDADQAAPEDKIQD
jgi:hypothetical protein